MATREASKPTINTRRNDYNQLPRAHPSAVLNQHFKPNEIPSGLQPSPSVDRDRKVGMLPDQSCPNHSIEWTHSTGWTKFRHRRILLPRGGSCHRAAPRTWKVFTSHALRCPLSRGLRGGREGGKNPHVRGGFSPEGRQPHQKKQKKKSSTTNKV
jgi:hypothetical protein